MALVVGGLVAWLGDRQELVAHVDERHPAPAPAEREREEPAVEVERFLDAPDLDRDVVDPDQPCGVRHRPSLPAARRRSGMVSALPAGHP